jgi:hypothetical protein
MSWLEASKLTLANTTRQPCRDVRGHHLRVLTELENLHQTPFPGSLPSPGQPPRAGATQLYCILCHPRARAIMAREKPQQVRRRECVFRLVAGEHDDGAGCVDTSRRPKVRRFGSREGSQMHTLAYGLPFSNKQSLFLGGTVKERKIRLVAIGEACDGQWRFDKPCQFPEVL